MSQHPASHIQYWLALPESIELANKLAGDRPPTLYERKLAAMRVEFDSHRRAKISEDAKHRLTAINQCHCGSCQHCHRRQRNAACFKRYHLNPGPRKAASQRSRIRMTDMYNPTDLLPSVGLYGTGLEFPNFVTELVSVIRSVR